VTLLALFVFFGGIAGLLVAAYRQWRPRYVIGLGVAVLLSSVPVFLFAVFVLLLTDSKLAD
jgi:hypothetical protein